MQPVTRQFKKVNTVVTYRKWNFWKEGDYLIGKYIKTEEKPYGKEMKKQYVLEIEETNFNKSGFVDPKGKAKDCGNQQKGQLIALNDNTTLANALEAGKVRSGDVVKITFTGSYLVSSGPYAGKEGKRVELEIAEIAEENEIASAMDI